MTVEQRFEEPNDQFPVGMRVLAVDDDRICLKLLETLLRKCQYHVTTTGQAITALKLLRENRDKFDLVISDVHMPDMDGFKLLELVGLEMDLPVIMLSANGDTKLVMKGITHGACDYLLKPIRIEELKNIWQHVVRRKKFDPKDKNNSDKTRHGSEGGQGLTGTGDHDQNGKLNRKRKDQIEDDDEDRGDNSDDPSTQKKPRVVWTVDLHRKFVAAVNQLGIDKAVPKRILDMMNVEKLTRENVASHLQKYRLYLKRISCVASQQANLAAAFGGPDSYLRMSPLHGFGNPYSSAQLQSASVRSFSSSGMLGRLSTTAGLGMRGLSSSGMIQLGHAENYSNPINDPSKFLPNILSGSHNGNNILQGVPTSLEFDQLQNNKGIPISGDFTDGNVNCGSSSNSLLGFPYNPATHPQESERRGVCGNQSINVEFPSQLPDFAGCDDSWPTIQSTQIQSNSLTSADCFKQDGPTDGGNNYLDISSMSSVPAGFTDLRTDLQCQAVPGLGSNLMCNSMSSVPFGGPVQFGQRMDPKNTVCNRSNDFDVIGRANLVNPVAMQQPNEVEQSAMERIIKLKQGYLVDQRNQPNGHCYNNVGSLEDLVSAMMKQQQDDLITGKGIFGGELSSPKERRF